MALEEEITPDEFWMSVKDTFLDTANNILGWKRKRKDKPWISQDTLKLMDVRRSLKKHKSRTPEDSQAYCRAKAEVQRQVRQDKKLWLEEQCAQVEQGLQQNSTKHAYEIVKKLRKEFTPKHGNIHDELGNVLSDLDDIKARWKR